MRAKSRKSRQQTTPFRFLSNIEAQPSTSEGNIGKPFACHNAFMAFRNSNFEQFPSSRSSYLCVIHVESISPEMYSKSKVRPPTASSDEDESYRWRVISERPQDAAISTAGNVSCQRP